MTPDLFSLVRVLSSAGVDYIIVGGVAGNLPGTTLDLDIVYSRTPDNVSRLVAALSPYRPYLRGAPPGQQPLCELGRCARCEDRQARPGTFS